jgi:hypothetical protein
MICTVFGLAIVSGDWRCSCLPSTHLPRPTATVRPQVPSILPVGWSAATKQQARQCPTKRRVASGSSPHVDGSLPPDLDRLQYRELTPQASSVKPPFDCPDIPQRVTCCIMTPKATLMGMPREVRDHILGFVLAPDAPPTVEELVQQQLNNERCEIPSKATGAWEESRSVRFLICQPAIKPLPLLLVSRQLKAETEALTKRHGQSTFSLDIVFLNDVTLWPTWTNVPKALGPDEVIDELHVQWRMFKASELAVSVRCYLTAYDRHQTRLRWTCAGPAACSGLATAHRKQTSGSHIIS